MRNIIHEIRIWSRIRPFSIQKCAFLFAFYEFNFGDLFQRPSSVQLQFFGEICFLNIQEHLRWDNFSLCLGSVIFNKKYSLLKLLNTTLNIYFFKLEVRVFHINSFRLLQFFRVNRRLRIFEKSWKHGYNYI